MIPDLQALRRKAYAEAHPERDTRAHHASDDVEALARATEQCLSEINRRVSRLEAKLTRKDAE